MTSLLIFLLQERWRSQGLRTEEKGTEQGSLGAPGGKARSGPGSASGVTTATTVRIQLWGYKVFWGRQVIEWF